MIVIISLMIVLMILMIVTFVLMIVVMIVMLVMIVAIVILIIVVSARQEEGFATIYQHLSLENCKINISQAGISAPLPPPHPIVNVCVLFLSFLAVPLFGNC